MKVIFVGPSLPHATEHAGSDVSLRPPARQGDVMRALDDGATTIGLIDGFFEHAAPVWHKELLFALSRGVAVYGASSMGALRAAECAPFGMIGVGRIFEDYLNGVRVDDADVALLHGPQELRYPALTVPLVNVDATLTTARDQGLITEAMSVHLSDCARRLFYKERSWKRIANAACVDWAGLAQIIEAAHTDQKRIDALQLIAIITSSLPRQASPLDWSFNTTPLWRKLYGSRR